MHVALGAMTTHLPQPQLVRGNGDRASFEFAPNTTLSTPHPTFTHLSPTIYTMSEKAGTDKVSTSHMLERRSN